MKMMLMKTRSGGERAVGRYDEEERKEEEK